MSIERFVYNQSLFCLEVDRNFTNSSFAGLYNLLVKGRMSSRGMVKRSGIRNSGTIWRTAVIEGETVVVFLTGDWRVMSIRKEYRTFRRGMQT